MAAAERLIRWADDLRCFYHPETDAVGICKSCSRGVCTACAAEVTNGLACSDRCESEVLALDHQIQRARTQTSAGGKLYIGAGAVLLSLGLWLQEPGAAVFGGILLGLGAFWYLRGRSPNERAAFYEGDAVKPSSSGKAGGV